MIPDHLPVLRNPSLARNAGPIRTRMVIEANINMLIRFDFIEFVRSVVSEEDEVETVSGIDVVGCTGCHCSGVEVASW